MASLTKKIARVLAVLLMVNLVFGSGVIPYAHAAGAPTQNIYIYPLDAGQRNIPAFSDRACTNRTGLVYGTDRCRILECYGDVLWLEYPTASGSRRAYVRTSDFTKGNFASAQAGTMNEKAPVYSYETGGATIGTVFKNDKIYVLYSGSSRSQIIYPIGNNEYKAGWIDWTPQQSGTGNTASIKDGYYYIASKLNTNMVGDVWNGNGVIGNGNNFQLYTKKTGSDAGNQLIHIVHVSGEWYKLLISADESFCIEVFGGRITSGENNVSLWKFHPNDNDGQLWRFRRCEDGSYVIESKLGDFVLDLARGSTAEETNILCYEAHGGENQKWFLIEAAAPKTGSSQQTGISQRQRAMADTALSYLGNTGFNGYCQSFVRVVGEKTGLPRGNAGSALHAYQMWCVSTSMDNIPVGAAVYLRSKNTSSAGFANGHVGIYVGDGQVVHALSTVRKQSLSSLLSSYTWLGWGWQSGVDLR